MAIQFDSNVQALTYKKVADYLKRSSLFESSLTTDPEQPKFEVCYGSTVVDIEVLVWEVHPWEQADLSTVRATSCVTIDSTVSPDLMRYLLTENGRMRFGAFHLGTTGKVLFAESVLGGGSMDVMELQTCILSVATIADTYDDIIVRRFGGHRAVDQID